MLEGLTFLEEGKYTPRDERVERTARVLKRFSGSIHRNISLCVARLDLDKSRKDEVYRKRTASQILEDGYVTGCTDAALAFISLSRESGIPARYVETLGEDCLKNFDPEKMRGHVFVDILINGKWVPYEPIGGFTTNNKYVLGNRKFVEIGIGLDFSEIYLKENGVYRKEPVKIKSYEDIAEIARKMSQTFTSG